jgi:ubiquitin-activating enzyme E1
MNKMEIDTTNENKIDEELYSRALYVMGHEAQKRVQSSSVLIVGLNGLGIETSKNIVLAGCKSVTLYDNELTKFADLSSQFYLNEDDIGKSRSVVSAPKLSELNPYVNVSILDVPELSVEQLSKHNFTVIVLIDQSLALQLEISEYCHNNNIQFLIGDAKGVFGSIFCDFGRDFQVNDVNGEPVLTSMVIMITYYFNIPLILFTF